MSCCRVVSSSRVSVALAAKVSARDRACCALFSVTFCVALRAEARGVALFTTAATLFEGPGLRLGLLLLRHCAFV